MPFGKSVIYATSAVSDGNMSFLWGEHARVVESREKFLAKHRAKLDDSVVMSLEHGDVVKRVGAEARGAGARAPGEGIVAEALITQNPGTILFMLTGDCLPIAYYDPHNHAIALAHLSWKSSDLHLAYKVVEEMRREFGTNPQELLVSFGPCIHKESYIQDVVEQQESPQWEQFLKKLPDGRTSINIIGYNVAVLAAAGVATHHITVSPIDTAADPAYFSHYRALRTGEAEGRFATILGLKRFDSA